MQQRRMVQTEDLAASQVSEIDQALDDATSGYTAFGHHHLTVLCVEPSLADLDKAVADVEAALVDIGIVSVREDLNLEAAFWAQLPGNFPYIARRALISTANFAGFASLHNYPLGQASGNHWGPAVTLLETVSGHALLLQLAPRRGGSHAADRADRCGQERGHELPARPEREVSAARVLLRQGPRRRDLHSRARRNLRQSRWERRTRGFNPLQLPDTPFNRAFLDQWLTALVAAFGEPLTAEESMAISQAVDGNYSLPLSLRTLENVAPFLGIAGPGTLAGRLSTWHGSGSSVEALRCA